MTVTRGGVRSWGFISHFSHWLNDENDSLHNRNREIGV
jgi:hypothetical protein